MPRWRRLRQKCASKPSLLTYPVLIFIPLFAAIRRTFTTIAVGVGLSISCATAAPGPASDRIVVVVSLDGFASFYLNDPKADLPTLRRLADEGVVARGMKASLPTMTWPNHTTLVTGVSPGRHGVIANNYWDREKAVSKTLIADPIFLKDEIVKVPTVYDVVHDAGLKTAGINWPAARGAPTLDWTLPDVHSNSLFTAYATPGLLDEMRSAGIKFDHFEEWSKKGESHMRDELYTKTLVHVIKEHRPNLALVHLIDADHLQHLHGPRSPEVYKALRVLDDYVKEIWEVMEKEFPGRATLMVVSDHGFSEVRQKIQPNVLLRQAGLLQVRGMDITERRVFAFPQGGSCFIYVLDKKNRGKLSKQVAAMFKGVEGVDRVILPKDYKKSGMIPPDEDPRMADLVLTAKEGYTFSNVAAGDVLVTPASDKLTGTHGHDPEFDNLKALFIGWGAGVKAGVDLKQIDNRDVAPTAAALLGVKMKNVEGRVLREMLKK